MTSQCKCGKKPEGYKKLHKKSHKKHHCGKSHFNCDRSYNIIIKNKAICKCAKARGARGATQLRGMEVQLLGVAATVAPGAPVIFDTIVSSQSPFISYNSLTGQIIITQTGVFYINWWVSTDGILGGLDVTPTFSIVSSDGNNIRASSPNVTNQMSGNALMEITASPVNPVTLQLINATDGTIGFATTPIKADLTIVNVTF
jgi:hypothetical protein